MIRRPDWALWVRLYWRALAQPNCPITSSTGHFQLTERSPTPGDSTPGDSTDYVSSKNLSRKYHVPRQPIYRWDIDCMLQPVAVMRDMPLQGPLMIPPPPEGRLNTDRRWTFIGASEMPINSKKTTILCFISNHIVGDLLSEMQRCILL